MTTKTKKAPEKEWEKEFDKEIYKELRAYGWDGLTFLIKDFISRLLSSQLEEIEEWAKGMRYRRNFSADIEYAEGYRNAKDDLLSKLEEMKKNL